MRKKLIIFIIVFMTFINPSVTFASDDLIIKNWTVEANLLEDGSLSVIKNITYDFNKGFNGIYIDILLDDIMELLNVKIYEYTSEGLIEYVQNQSSKKGDYGVYSMDLNKDHAKIMIFSPSNKEQKTFKVEYILKNVATVHSDTGELYYKFIGTNNETYIEHFKANINLPMFNKENIKIFAHGPLNGNISFDNQSIKLEVNNLDRNTFVEARVLFPLEYIPLSTRNGNSTLTNIINEEKSFVEKNMEEELIRKERKSIFNNISTLLSAVSILILGFLLNKFKRNPSIFDEMNSIYPDEISPAELSLFMYSSLGPRAYIATLLNLARREIISFETILSNRSLNKWNKDKDLNAYLFIKNDTGGKDMMEHESFFVNWLFSEIGDGKKVSTEDIENFREKNAMKFYKSQNAWTKIITEELKSRNYYDPNGKKYGFYTLLISFILLGISIISLVIESLFGIMLLGFSLILMIYAIFLFQRKSHSGYIQYRLWKDFKKEANKINTMDLNLSTDLTLIYLIALGLPMKALDEYRQSVSMNYYPMYWGYYYFMFNSKGGSSFEDNFNSSFYGSTGTSTDSSSSFGGGGGFSGGGGGGVGGSGSGGF